MWDFKEFSLFKIYDVRYRRHLCTDGNESLEREQCRCKREQERWSDTKEEGVALGAGQFIYNNGREGRVYRHSSR